MKKFMATVLAGGLLSFASPSVAQLVNAPDGIYQETTSGVQIVLRDGEIQPESYVATISSIFNVAASQAESSGGEFYFNFSIENEHDYLWEIGSSIVLEEVTASTGFHFENRRISIQNNGPDEFVEVRELTQSSRYTGIPIPNQITSSSRDTTTVTWDATKNELCFITVSEDLLDVNPDEEFSGCFVLVARGTGTSPESPIIPEDADWREVVEILFPTINIDEITWADPPFAESFSYDIDTSKNPTARFTNIQLVDGFGSVELLVPPADGATALAVGEFAAGPLDLRNYTSNNEGPQSFTVRFLTTQPDLAEAAPYPIGLAFNEIGQVAVLIDSITAEGSAVTQTDIAGHLLDPSDTPPADQNGDTILDAADIQAVD